MPHAIAEQVNMIKKQTAKYRKNTFHLLKKSYFVKIMTINNMKK